MNQSRSLTASLMNIFVAPGEALDAAREHRRWLWWPLLLVIGAGIALWIWYYRTVDFAWLADRLLAGRDLSTDQARAASQFMTRDRSLGFACAGVVIGTLVIYVVQAGYLLLAARLTGEREIGFGQWFSLTAWTRLPSLLGIIAMAVGYGLASGNQVAPTALNVVSLNALLFHLEPAQHGFSLANSVTLTLIWSLGLLTYGVMRWLNRGALQALAIVVGPYVVIYGVWLTVILAR